MSLKQLRRNKKNLWTMEIVKMGQVCYKRLMFMILLLKFYGMRSLRKT
jgi:hypothetical protein